MNTWTYKTVIDSGLVLPQKRKYTMRDWKKLVPVLYSKGFRHPHNMARFIIYCSALYHNTDCSSVFCHTVKFQILDSRYPACEDVY